MAGSDVLACVCFDAVYTSFMYLEHDMSVPWTALLGWAEDFPILEPLGFQRGFYRVEPSEQTGLPGLTDQISRININKYDRKLNVSTLDNDGLIKVRHQQAYLATEQHIAVDILLGVEKNRTQLC